MAGSGAPDAGAASAEGYVAGPPEDPQRYRIDRADLESAATGGEGLVFRARDRHGRIVALKMLTAVSPDEFEQRQERARALVDVRHPNLMRHIETFLGAALSPASYPARQPDDVDLLYSVSEWIDGSPLPEATAGASTATRLGWVAELARAVAELHRTTGGDIPAGVVHRDIKPSNVRVTTAGRAILIDYGTSRAADDDLTQGVGTYLWRAPEVLGAVAAGPGTASDVWGVGAVAHWLLVGEPPQLDGAGAARHRVVQSEAARQLGDPDGVARLIGELLETVPGHRPTDLLTWARRLEQAAGRRRTRRRLVTAGRLALAAVVAIALAVWVWPRPSPERSAEVLGERQSRSSLTGSGEETPQVAVLAFGGDLSRQRRTMRTFVDPDLHIFDRRDGAYGAVVQPADHDPIQGYTPGPLLAAADGLTIYAPRSQDALPGLDLMLVDRSGGHWAVNFLAAAWTATGGPRSSPRQPRSPCRWRS